MKPGILARAEKGQELFAFDWSHSRRHWGRDMACSLHPLIRIDE